MADLTFIITIPSIEVAEYKEYFKESFNYPEKVSDPSNPADFIPNPESIASHVKKGFRDNLVKGFKNWKKRQIADAATISTTLKVE